MNVITAYFFGSHSRAVCDMLTHVLRLSRIPDPVLQKFNRDKSTATRVHPLLLRYVHSHRGPKQACGLRWVVREAVTSYMNSSPPIPTAQLSPESGGAIPLPLCGACPFV